MLSQEQWVNDGYCQDCGATRYVMGDKVIWEWSGQSECLHRVRNDHEPKERICTVCGEEAGSYTDADWYDMQEMCDDCWEDRTNYTLAKS